MLPPTPSFLVAAARGTDGSATRAFAERLAAGFAAKYGKSNGNRPPPDQWDLGGHGAATRVAAPLL